MKTRVSEYYNFRLCKPQLQVQVWRTDATYWLTDGMRTLSPFWEGVGREFDLDEYELARECARCYSMPVVMQQKEHIVFEDGKAV